MAEIQTTGLELEVWMRTFTPSVSQWRQQDVIDRVRTLEEDGRIEDVSINYWSTRVCTPDGDSDTERCPPVVEEVLSTVDDTDLSLEPHFRERERTPHQDCGVLFLPVVCVLVRRNGRLRGIYPITHDGTSESVMDVLDRLEAGENVENLSDLLDETTIAPGQ